jgi:hypothetical protein
MTSHDQAILGEARGGGLSRQEVVDALLRLVKSDLTHARAFHMVGTREMVFRGHCAISGLGREITHRPVEVNYRIEEVDGQSWLVRRQISMDVLTNRDVESDMVCAGITRVSLSRVQATSRKALMADGRPASESSEDSIDRITDDSEEREPDTQPPSAVGTVWRLRVWMAGAADESLDRFITVLWEPPK